MFRRLSLVYALIGVLLAARPLWAENISAEMQKEDSRLQSSVSFSNPHITLGALCKELSRQTGVKLHIDAEQPTSGITFFTAFKKMPLHEAMNCLWSAVSYRKALWEWQRIGKPDKYEYALVQPRSARELPILVRQIAWEALEHHCEVMQKIAMMPPEKRKEALQELADSLMQPDTKMAARHIAAPRWDRVRTFVQGLTPEQRRRIIRGDSIRIPKEKLSEDVRTSFSAAWRAMQAKHKDADGNWVDTPEPDTLRFYSLSGGDVGKRVVPTYYMGTGDDSGISFMGGDLLEDGLLQTLEKWWLHPGDQATSPHEQFVPKLPDGRAATQREIAPFSVEQISDGQAKRFRPVWEQRLTELAEASPVSLCALLPIDRNFDPGTTYNRPVQKLLMRDGVPYASYKPFVKWRGDTLLMTYPYWYEDSEEYVPYALHQQIQKWERGATPTALELAKLASPLSEAQWNRLLRTSTYFFHLEEARMLLSYCATNTDFTRQNGVRVEDIPRNVLPSNTLSARTGITLLRVRTMPSTGKSVEIVPAELRIEGQTEDRKWKRLYGWPLPTTKDR